MCVFDPARLGLPHQQLQRWQGIDPLAVLDIRNPRLEATMGWLCGELLQPSFASQLHITSMLTLLTLETQRHFGGPLPPEETGSRLNGRQWSLVKELIEQAPPAELSVHQLARACGLPGRNFPAMFRRTVGMPLRSFVAATHIEKAKLLLSDPQLLVKQVAMRSGFESASGFALAFRKATGMTPQQYRVTHGMQLLPESPGGSMGRYTGA
jgi:AraC family transcriptional regulator